MTRVIISRDVDVPGFIGADTAYFVALQKFKRIVRDPAICGGQPTIRGTRVLVRDILAWLRVGEPVEEILANFPSLTRADIQEILAYAREEETSP